MEFTHLIRFIAESVGIQKTTQDLKRFEDQISKLTGVHEKVISVEKKASESHTAFGRTYVKTLYQVQTESGRTFQILERNYPRSTSLINDFTNALRRVAIVVPVWYLFRQAFMQVVTTITEGAKQIVEFDKVLQKSASVIHGFTGDISMAVEILRDKIYNFSKESGISVEKLASAFYRFGTVGLPFEEAMAGMISSAKLARTTFGDVDEIARVLAMTYKLLGNTMDSALTPAQKMERITGMIYQLWRINAAEIGEFTQSLRQFIATGNIAGFTLEQTIALLYALQTAGLKGSQSGTLLSTAVFKLVENIDKLASVFGLAIKEGESTFDILMRILDVLSDTTKLDYSKLENITDIFGGVRGSKAIAGLIAMRNTLKENLDIVKNQEEAVGALNKRYEELSKTIGINAEKIENLKKHIGDAFIMALGGSTSLETALQNISSFLLKLAEASEGLTEGFKDIFGTLTSIFTRTDYVTEEVYKTLDKLSKVSETLQTISVKIRVEQLSDEELRNLQNQSKQIAEIAIKTFNNIRERFETERPELIKPLEDYLHSIQIFSSTIVSTIDDIINKHYEETRAVKEQEQLDIKRYELIKKESDLRKMLLDYQLKLKEAESDVSGLDNREKLLQTAKQRVRELVDLYNSLKLPEGKQILEVEPINFDKTFQLIMDILKGSVETKDILEYFKYLPDITHLEEFKNALSATLEYSKAELEYSQSLSDKEKERILIEEKLSIAKAQGLMSARELLEYEIMLYENANIYNSLKEKEQKLLELRVKLKAQEIELESKLSGVIAKREEFENRFKVLRQSSVLSESEILELYIKELQTRNDIYDVDTKRLKILDAQRELEAVRAKEAFELEQSKERLFIEQQLAEAKASGRYTEEELLILEAELIANSQTLYDNHEKQIEVLKKQVEILKQMYELTIKYGEEFRNTVQGNLKDLLKGEITIEDFFNNLKNKLIDMWAEAVSNNIVNLFAQTGIFGQMGGIFAGIERGGGLQTQIVTGGQLAGEIIKNNMILAGQTVAQAISTALGGGTAGVVGGGIGAGIPFGYMPGGFGFGIPIFGGAILGGQGGIYTGYQMTPMGLAPTWSPYGGIANIPIQRGWNIPFLGKLGKPLGAFWGGMTPLQLLFGGLIGGYAGYQTGGIAGGLMSGLGSILMMAGHPLLALPFFLGSLFFGHKKFTQTYSSWQPEKAPEVIPLEIMRGIAPLPKYYPLPESRYFALPRGRRMTFGGVNITINIDKVTGDADEIANTIADKIANIYNQDLNRGLNIIYP